MTTHEHQDAKVAKWALLGVLCAFVFAFCGCGTPRGYDADLTPDDNGEQWIGGAALSATQPDSLHTTGSMRAAMRAELAAHPWCAWCGTHDDLQVHHIIPISRNPALAAEPSNLIVLCRECHFVLGHKRDWRKGVWNLRTVIECALEIGPIGADEARSKHEDAKPAEASSLRSSRLGVEAVR